MARSGFLAWVRVRLGERTQPTLAVCGDPGTELLLGAFTLEGSRTAQSCGLNHFPRSMTPAMRRELAMFSKGFASKRIRSAF